jgi:hypothetical protein
MALKRPPSTRYRLGAALAAVVVLAGVTAACSVGDAHCTDNTVEEDRDDACPFGPPGGPQRKQADGCVVTFSDQGCSKTFADDVYPILVAPVGDGGGACTAGFCHGPAGSGAVALVVAETATPSELYAALAALTNEDGDPYVEEGATNAWFLCNVKATLGGGSAMPPTAGLTSPENVEIIEEWVRCGMKNDAGSGAGGGPEGGASAGGGPSAGGAGGA